jgi:polyisoprenyl-phosphate glycosyltransferase
MTTEKIKRNTEISIISPVYGCEKCLHELCDKVTALLEKAGITFEMILVEDHSPDNSWETMKQIANNNPHVTGIKLSRNFGQHKAIYAGLVQSVGEWVVVMDCDLQDRPEEIVRMYEAVRQKQLHILLGRRVTRQHNLMKRLFSHIFYKTLGYLTNTIQDSTIANFGIYHRKVIDAICSMNDSFKYFPTMVRWVGFKQGTIDIDHDKRGEGRSTYSVKKLIRLGLDVILAFSEKPLRLTVKLGLTISLFSLLFAVITLIRYFNGQITMLGYASLILSIWLLGGIIIFILGIIGLYLGKTFEKVKERPVYIVEETTDGA